MKFTLNTLGAPGWTLEETATNARAYGYAGVDLRLLDGEVITLESVRANRDRLRTLFPRAELPLAVLATSVRLATADTTVRQETLDEAREWIDLAADLQVPVIRYFAARNPPELDLERSIQAVGEMLALLSEHATQAGVKIGVETHDEFARSATVARALELAPSPAVGAIWDLYHTARMGETPAQALSQLGDRVLNVHLKDGRRTADGWQLLLLGEGEIPVKDALHLLHQRGYDDFISVEWEKKWHPEIPEPEVAFPQHLALLREYVRELGVTTIADVARLAGVGTTTVTKTLAGRKYVSEPTRQRIYEAIAALDYQPSAAGRMLRTGVTHVLGVITPPADAQPFTHYSSFSRVLDGIGEVAAAHGYDLLWITDAGDAVGSYAALFKSKRVDGLIDLYIHPHDPRIDGLTASGYPFVLIGIPEDETLPHVTAAHHDGGMLAGRAFTRRGYAPVGFIGLADSPASRGRFAGLQAALAEVGQAILPEHIGLGDRGGRMPDYEELGWTTMRRWLADNTVPRAVLTAWDSTAYGVLRACRESGLAVPNDLAIIGFDDEPPSRLLTPPLATVRGPLRELGCAAATLLLQLIAGTAPRPPCQVVPMSFVERESLGPLPSERENTP